MPNVPVLVISTDSGTIESVCEVIALVSGCQCFTVGRVDQATEFLADSPAALFIYHAASSSRQPLERLLNDQRVGTRQVATLVITDDDHPETVLSFLIPGVADCLPRPLDRSRLRFLIDSLTFRARNAPVPAVKVTKVDSHPAGGTNAFDESGMTWLMRVTQKVARQDSTVLLTGETGVGKTRLARLIHGLSPRQKDPFLVVNCAALPENLLESELFGHCKGSFTGAGATRVGRFAAAGTGTLFLDEVDSLPLVLQKKLLRAVDERVFEPVGSNQSQPIHARLIVATNRELAADVEAGSFRSDLYYRLNVIELAIPPLRCRRNAIRGIAESHLHECATRNNRTVPRVTAEVWEALTAFGWPGNIRELRNAIERALALCDDRLIVLEDLPDAVQASFRQPSLADGPDARRDLTLRIDSPVHESTPLDNEFNTEEWRSNVAASPLAQARAEGELECLKDAIRRAGNNRTRAAAELGISRASLYKKLHRFGLLDSSELVNT